MDLERLREVIATMGLNERSRLILERMYLTKRRYGVVYSEHIECILGEIYRRLHRLD